MNGRAIWEPLGHTFYFPEGFLLNALSHTFRFPAETRIRFFRSAGRTFPVQQHLHRLIEL